MDENQGVTSQVPKGAVIYSDDARVYQSLSWYGYRHRAVNHSAGEYVREDAHTNSIEGFWAMIKRSIRGTHIHVSAKHLPKYLGEFEYRFNMGKEPDAMFRRLLLSF